MTCKRLSIGRLKLVCVHFTTPRVIAVITPQELQTCRLLQTKSGGTCSINIQRFNDISTTDAVTQQVYGVHRFTDTRIPSWISGRKSVSCKEYNH